MKRIAAFLFAALAVCYLQATPADAQFNRDCHIGFCHPTGGTPPTPIGQACSAVSGTVTTFTAQGIGPAAPSRITVLSINWSDSTAAGTAELTSVTVGGIPMARAVRASGDNQNSNSEIWYVSNPLGTSANIVVTASTAIDGLTIGIYSLIGYTTIVPIATTTGTTSVSQAYNNKQVAIAAGSRTTNVSTTLSNLINNFSTACGTGLWGIAASGALSGNGKTLTSAINPTSSNPKIALAIWAAGTGTGPVTGTVAWWDLTVAGSVSTSGANVTGVTDQSGNGHSLVVRSGSNSPQYNATGLNGLPTMTCTAASTQGMTSASIPLGTGNTLSFWVINTFTTNTGVDGRLLSYNALGQAHDYDNAASFNMARKGGNAPLQMVRNSVGMGFAADEPLTPVRLIGTIDSSGIMKYYVNGTLWQTSSASAGNWTTGGTAGVCISLNDPTGVYWDGKVTEVGISNTFLDAGNVTGLDTYLQVKYSPTLTSPSATTVGAIASSVSVTSNRSGGTIYIVQSTSSVTPSATQIIAGQDGTGAAGAYAGTISSPIVGANTASTTGLAASTTYYTFFLHSISTNFNSPVTPAGSFTTNAFNPNVDLSGVITWLDASVTASLNLTGSTVNSITDQSSNAYVFGVNGAIAKPTYSATGFNTSFPSLLFAGSPGQSLAKSSYGMGTGNTITTWAVMRRTSGGDNDARLWSYTAAAASHDYDNAGSWLLDTVNSSPQSYMFRNLQKSIGTIVIGNNYRIIGTINASGVITTYINGVAQSTQTASGNWVSAGILAIGDTSIAGDPSRFDGAIAEAGVATGFSNAATVSQLDLYLKNKWGL